MTIQQIKAIWGIVFIVATVVCVGLGSNWWLAAAAGFSILALVQGMDITS